MAAASRTRRRRFARVYFALSFASSSTRLAIVSLPSGLCSQASAACFVSNCFGARNGRFRPSTGISTSNVPAKRESLVSSTKGGGSEFFFLRMDRSGSNGEGGLLSALAGNAKPDHVVGLDQPLDLVKSEGFVETHGTFVGGTDAEMGLVHADCRDALEPCSDQDAADALALQPGQQVDVQVRGIGLADPFRSLRRVVDEERHALIRRPKFARLGWVGIVRAQFGPPVDFQCMFERLCVVRAYDVAADTELVLDHEGRFRREHAIGRGIDVPEQFPVVIEVRGVVAGFTRRQTDLVERRKVFRNVWTDLCLHLRNSIVMARVPR